MAHAGIDGGHEPPRGGDAGGPRRLLVPAALVIVLVAAGVIVAPRLFSGPAATPSAVPTAPGSPSAVAELGSPTPGATGAATGPNPSPAAATSAHDPRRIAVVDAAGALSTTDDAGGPVTPYPQPGIVFGFPAWSPDGTRVAVVGYGPSETSIYVFAARAGGAATPPDPVVIYRSTESPPFYLYWMPDGRQIAFLATEGTGISLRIAPADGSAPLDGSGPGSVVRRGAPLYYDWAGAGRLLLHVGLGTGSFTGEVGIDGAAAAPEITGTGDYRTAGISRDGRFIAYARSATGPEGAVVVAARNGTSHHDMPVFGPAAFDFDPAGDIVATIGADKPVTGAPAFPVGPLRLMDPETGAVRTLLGGSVVAFFWAPDGRTIATLSLVQGGPTADAGVTLARAAPVASLAPPATPLPGADIGLAFVDVATGTVRSQRVVRLGDHFIAELLPYFDQYALSHRIWSSDGAAILLPLVDETGRTTIDEVPADGTSIRAIADGVSAFWSP